MEQVTVENKTQLGELLVARGAVTTEQVQEALEHQRDTDHQKLVGEILVDKGYCTENDIAAALSVCFNIPYAKITPRLCDPKVIEILPLDFMEEHSVLPLFRVHNMLTIAVSEPANLFQMDEIEQITGYKIQMVCATAKDIQATLRAYSSSANVFVVDDLIEDQQLDHFQVVEHNVQDLSHLEEAASQHSVIELVHYLLCDAVRNNASDLHIEPDEKSLRIRYRVDGRLYEKMRPPHQMHAALVSRLKIMAELDITQRRLAQEGNIRILVDDRPIDLRLSLMPGNCGEKVAIRVVDPKKILLNLESLGFTLENLQQVRKMMQAHYGLVLVTGPAGSGKKTTLHAMIGELNREEVNICTVEDPLECNIVGVNQFEVNTCTGGHFSQTLQHVMRQDPDVIMLSEIRDDETAVLAVQAALTGTLVLSTLSTSDAPSAVIRLMDHQVPSYLASDALIGVLAQRLVRKICPDCKTRFEPSYSVRKAVDNLNIKIPEYFRGTGCKKCRHTGFAGRIAMHELFVLDHAIKDMISSQTKSSHLRSHALKAGMNPLVLDGLEKVRAGLISIDEVLRCVQLKLD